MPRKSMTFQFDLISNTRDSAIAPMPQWQTLPIPMRQKLMPLIVRLLIDHASVDRDLALEEVRDDF